VGQLTNELFVNAKINHFSTSAKQTYYSHCYKSGELAIDVNWRDNNNTGYEVTPIFALVRFGGHFPKWPPFLTACNMCHFQFLRKSTRGDECCLWKWKQETCYSGWFIKL